MRVGLPSSSHWHWDSTSNYRPSKICQMDTDFGISRSLAKGLFNSEVSMFHVIYLFPETNNILPCCPFRISSYLNAIARRDIGPLLTSISGNAVSVSPWLHLTLKFDSHYHDFHAVSTMLDGILPGRLPYGSLIWHTYTDLGRSIWHACSGLFFPRRLDCNRTARFTVMRCL